MICLSPFLAEPVLPVHPPTLALNGLMSPGWRVGAIMLLCCFDLTMHFCFVQFGLNSSLRITSKLSTTMGHERQMYIEGTRDEQMYMEQKDAGTAKRQATREEKIRLQEIDGENVNPLNQHQILRMVNLVIKAPDLNLISWLAD